MNQLSAHVTPSREALFSAARASSLGTLGQQVAAGATWLIALRMFDRLVGIVSFGILARLLLPEHFGLLALATALIGFLDVMSDPGLDLALIRHNRPDRCLYDTAWTLKIIKGGAIASLLVAGAHSLGTFFSEPRLEGVIYGLALAAVLQSFENIGIVEFRTQLRFERDVAYLVTTRLISTALALALAFILRNHWALVGGILLQRAVQVAVSYGVHPYRPRLSLAGFAVLSRFSKWLMLQNFSHGLNIRVPSWIIGRLTGIEAVALYDVSHEVATLTTTELRAPIRRALFPGFAKLASNPDALRKGLVQAYAVMTMIGLPIPVGMAVVAPWLVRVFLGPQWEAAVPVFQILAVYGIVQAIGTSSHVAYLALNRPQLSARLTILQLVLSLPLLVVATAHAGAVGAAWALVWTSVCVAVIDFLLLTRVLAIDPGRFIIALKRPVSASLVMLLGLLPFSLSWLSRPDAWLPAAIHLLNLAGLGLLLYCSTLLFLWHRAGRPDGPEQLVYTFFAQQWHAMRRDKIVRKDLPPPPDGAPSFIIFGTNEWSDIWHTRQYMASTLAKRGWPVVYTTGVSDWSEGWQACPSPGWTASAEVQHGVVTYRPGKMTRRWGRWKWWDRMVLQGHARAVQQLAGWDRAAHRVAYVFHPRFLPYIEHLPPCTVVYHMDDAFSLMPGWTSRCEDLQTRLAARADLILAASPGMVKCLPARDRSRARLFANGVDASAYTQAIRQPCPPDLARIPQPRIGYTGSVNMKVDLGLVAELARRRPKWHWVIIGPVTTARFEGFPGNREFHDDLAACRLQSNIHFLGAKPHQVLTSYVGHMDVNTMCYRRSPQGWWTAIYPLKLHEYLAAGRPIVGTDLEVLREFTSAVDIAKTPEEWIAALDRAITEGGVSSIAGRQSLALQNTWDARVDALIGWLNSNSLGPQAAEPNRVSMSPFPG